MAASEYTTAISGQRQNVWNRSTIWRPLPETVASGWAFPDSVSIANGPSSGVKTSRVNIDYWPKPSGMQ